MKTKAKKDKSKRKSSKTKVVSTQARMVPPRRLSGIFIITISVLIIFSILSYSYDQYNSTEIGKSNWVGMFGVYVGHYGFHYLGAAIYLFPFLMGFLGYRFLFEQQRGLRIRQFLLVLSATLSLSCLLATISNSLGLLGFLSEVLRNQLTYGLGGMIGTNIVENAFQKVIGTLGCILVFSIILVSSLYIGLGDNLGSLSKFLSSMAASLYKSIIRFFNLIFSFFKSIVLKLKNFLHILLSFILRISSLFNKKKQNDFVLEKNTDILTKPLEGSIEKDKENFIPENSIKEVDLEHKKPPLDPTIVKVIKGEKTEKAIASIPERRGDYVFPTINLLKNAPELEGHGVDDHVLMMEALVQTLDEFGVKVKPGEIFTGPVITRYEVTPAAGVRVEKIANLDRNIALGLRALSVRILAPVPGKGTVGIEVPNRIAQAVCMRDIIESKAWASSSSEIPVVLGKDVTGRPMVEDLTKMPHVLIAGSTGSGKTVCINTIIASLLYHSGPEDLRFLMVDPKVVEMQLYNALPHMLIPVVTEPKKVPGALKWLMAEMDRRYQIFAKTKVRNIAGFNAKITKDKAEQERAKEMEADMTAEERAAASQIEVPRDDDAFEVPKKKLPYIVCIIDELADLMMAAPADIETGIARIAQLARAAGIHLILATQRPSVNVITGVIKANLPSRIAFKVASKVDSRTILDGPGAEALIGKGDMLFIPPGTSNLVRAQGAFVSDEEINGIVDFLKEKNDPPVFAEAVQRQIDSSDEDSSGLLDGGEDEMLNKALGVLKSSKRASTSMLQRRLRIGYNRAARLMEELEDRGIVGPENGSSPREILVDLDAL